MLNLGIAITTPGNASELKTGDWAAQRPVTDREKCTKCAQCYIFCPDMVYGKTPKATLSQTTITARVAESAPKNAL